DNGEREEPGHAELLAVWFILSRCRSEEEDRSTDAFPRGWTGKLKYNLSHETADQKEMTNGQGSHRLHSQVPPRSQAHRRGGGGCPHHPADPPSEPRRHASARRRSADRGTDRHPGGETMARDGRPTDRGISRQPAGGPAQADPAAYERLGQNGERQV